ncbi:MAG: hypothetical protein K9M98_14365, partial [Cephaloticoccus sp.]|nr:hypothetical protein [Cephaloticoccus sp.]
LLPPEPFAFGPPITDRTAWSAWQNDPFGQRVLAEARKLATEPCPALDDAAYNECLDENSVTRINQLIPAVRTRNTVFLFAEAIYDQGEFLQVLESDARQLGQLSSWIHPGNDLDRKNLRGEAWDNDLASCHHAVNFAHIHHILGPRLSGNFRDFLAAELERRFFGPLRRKIETGRDLDWWLIVKHNWSSVCLSCYAQTAVAILPSVEERAWWLAFTESLIYNFTDGFADDGLCTEGVSYWGYGVSHFFTIAEIIRQGTGNTVDLLDNPKARRIARFPDRAEIQPGIYPAFCDCLLDAKPMGWARMWLDNRINSQPDGLTEPVPADFDPFADMKLQMSDVTLMWMFRTRAPRQALQRRSTTALRDYFAPSHFLICRSSPTTKRKFAATFLGGNNGVNHNHNDLGTFTVLLDGKSLIYDPGLEVYSMRTFSKQRYESQLLNSYGHPVPRIGGRLQETGPTRQAPTLLTEFSDEVDRMVLDLRGGYDCPTLRKLEREFIFDRRGNGSLTITDTVEFSEPTEFESALITPGAISEVGATLHIGVGETAIRVDYSGSSVPLKISRDIISQPPHPTRVALSPHGPILTATVQFVIRPE